MKRIILLLLAMLLLLTGCRTRTTAARTVSGDAALAGTSAEAGSTGENASSASAFSAEYEDTLETDSQTVENPAAQRREYNDQANAEVFVGSPHLLHGEGLGDGTPYAADDENTSTADQLRGEEARTATQTIPAAEAEKKGVSEDAPDADSSLTYYTVLLEERTASLFECQKKDLYWETAQPYRTVFKKSPEHYWILQSGCYDVSARLLEENLTVDAGWVQRKNPGVVVKIVDKTVLGYGVTGMLAAEAELQSLLSRPGWDTMDAVRNERIILASEQLLTSQHLRTALLLAIAKTAAPELYEDVNIDEALRSLSQEAAGAPAEGILLYIPSP